MTQQPHRLPSPFFCLFFCAALATLTALCTTGTAAAADGVYPNAEAVVPLGSGARVPSAVVQSVTGEPVDLADLVRESGALLVFYRGGW